jgi:glutaredoxin
MVNNDGNEFSKQIDKVNTCRITVFTRHGCHLCHAAIDLLESMRSELDFTIEKIYIDGDEKLEKLYGEQIPVIHINGEHHDFFRVDPDRFRSSLEKHRQRQ